MRPEIENDYGEDPAVNGIHWRCAVRALLFRALLHPDWPAEVWPTREDRACVDAVRAIEAAPDRAHLEDRIALVGRLLYVYDPERLSAVFHAVRVDDPWQLMSDLHGEVDPDWAGDEDHFWSEVAEQIDYLDRPEPSWPRADIVQLACREDASRDRLLTPDEREDLVAGVLSDDPEATAT